MQTKHFAALYIEYRNYKKMKLFIIPRKAQIHPERKILEELRRARFQNWENKSTERHRKSLKAIN